MTKDESRKDKNNVFSVNSSLGSSNGGSGGNYKRRLMRKEKVNEAHVSDVAPRFYNYFF